MSGKLFVGGISWETTEESLKAVYEEFGEVSEVIIMRDRATLRPRGFGFVTFADPEVANKVAGQKHTVDGREVETKLSVPRDQIAPPEPFKHPVPEQLPQGVKLFLGGIGPVSTEESLKEYFAKFGEVQEMVIMKDRNTGVSRGFGFCTFVRPHSAAAVLDESKAHEIDGKPVEVKPAESRESMNLMKGKGGGKGGGGYVVTNAVYGGNGGPIRGYGGPHMGGPGYGGMHAPPAYGYDQGYPAHTPHAVHYGNAPVYAGQPHAGYDPSSDWNAGYVAEQIPPPPEVPPPPSSAQNNFAQPMNGAWQPAMAQDGVPPPPPAQYGQQGGSRHDRAHPYSR